MTNIQLAILSNSNIVNRGLQFIFNKMRGLSVVEISNDWDNVQNLIRQQRVNFLMVSDELLMESDSLVMEYKTNKELRWGLIRTGNYRLNRMYHFELEISLTDRESELLENIQNFIYYQQNNPSSDFAESELSEREKEILKHVALGHTNAEIAEKLFISQHTVITHRKKITNKLGIKTISGLTVYAILNNLIEMGEVNI